MEDDPSTAVALRGIFRSKGWDVTVASTLADARPLLRPPPDALILDLMLPDGDGEALLAEIRATALPIRVVVTTGVNDSSRLAAVSALAPSALLRKPIALADLLRALGPRP